MKRKVYKNSAGRTRLVQEALATAREAREAIDPALLETARAAIGAAAERHGGGSRPFKSIQLDRVPVDQKKNLSIVLKFLELHPENKALQQEIRSFLSQGGA